MTKSRKSYFLMTTAAAFCAVPLLAFGQTQAAPDGTPGNPPSTAVQRSIDSVTGNRTDADGTGNNPPGTAAGRAMERATDGTTTRAPDGTPGNPPGTAASRAMDRATTPGAPATTTGATTGTMAVDSARLQGGRRASRLIGANIYNENNESVGEVSDIIIPTAGGNLVAILSVGGFLGIGDRLVAVPYERLEHAADRNRWILRGVTKDALKEMPAYTYDDAARRG